MKPDEFASHDGMGLASLVRRREVSAIQILDVAVTSVETRNPVIDAVVFRLYQAEAATTAGPPSYSGFTAPHPTPQREIFLSAGNAQARSRPAPRDRRVASSGWSRSR